MTNNPPTKRWSALLLTAAIICFAAAAAFGIVLPVLTTALAQISWGVLFLVLGVLILAVRARGRV